MSPRRIALALLLAGGVFTVTLALRHDASADPPETVGSSTVVVAWNDLGMHCEDDDYSVFSLLPPYNTVVAQVVRNGDLVTNTTGLTVTYEAVADPSGSINSTSIGKSDFWLYAQDLYGMALAPDVGLAGFAMPGLANVPQRMTFDPGQDAYVAEGIPITPLDDAQQENTYPMMRVTVRDAQNAVLATTDVVLPVSDELTCIACHGSNTVADAMPSAGWENDPDPAVDYRLNILRLHDEANALNPLYATSLAAAGYDSSGLYANVKVAGKPVLCAACHETNALPGSGLSGVPALTSALHSLHAMVIDPTNGLTLEASENRSSCYRCHPGAETRCLRGAMGASVASDGSLDMQCQDCHGSMIDVGAPSRVGWFDEPSCQSCHTGTATKNSGKIRYTSVFDSSGEERVAADDTFATDPNTPSTGFDLYRFSEGHGGLLCSACHGSTHAIYPSSHPNDNVQSVLLQGQAGTIADCATCHGGSPNTVSGGPHGMHPVGQSWIHGHEDAGSSKCRACHGKDYKGTVLSRALGDRVLSTKFGTKHFWKGFRISCWACHDGPEGEGKTKDKPPVVTDASAATDNAMPVEIKLKAKDKDGDGLKLRVVSQPAHGTVGLDGKVATYFPEAGYVGPDLFTFAAWDGKIDSNLGTVTLTVEDAGCKGTLTPAAVTVPVEGGGGAVDVALDAACAWTAAVDDLGATWLTLPGATSGMGPGTVTWLADPNPTLDPRSATVTIAERTLTVEQDGLVGPDLIGIWKSLTETCVGTGPDLRCKLKIAFKVRNVGNKKAAKSVVRFYLSGDDTFDGGDLLLAEEKVPKLKAGKTDTTKLKVKLPPGVTAAGMFVLGVVDAANVVVEVDEANNVTAATP